MTGLRKTTLFLTLCFLFLTALVYGQFESAEVLGTVRDTSGAIITGATVTLTNLETGIQSQGATDDSGDYDFFNVRVGRYSLSVEKPGFEKFTTKDVRVDVNARQRVDAALQVGAVTESIEVSGAAASLDTDSSEHGQVVNTQQILELPLNGRNYSDLALLTTNVHRSIYAYAVPPREGAFNVNGMRSTYNSFLLDGIDNNAYSTSNQGYSNQVAQPSPDAIAEFKVITSNYSAEYGRVGGAVVNAATRSGTNQVHGTAYEFLRNTDLNAVGFIFVPPPKFVKPPLQRNQFGFTVGAPIIKNKLFFFGDYEGYRSLQRAYTFDTIPSATDREGVLPVPVVDPVNGTVYQAGSTLPVSANAFAATVLSQLPTVGATRSNDFQALLLTRDFYDKFDAKIDYQINNKSSAFVRYSQRKDAQYYEPDLDPSPSGGSGNGNVKAQDQNAVLGYTFTVTPNSLLDARLAFSHILGGKWPVFLGGQSMQTEYGVSGLPTAPYLTGGLDTQNITGFSTVIGRQATNPQFQIPTSWDPKVNYSWMHGRHALKAGFEMGIIHTEVMDINPVYGLNAYAGQFSKPTCAELGLATGCSIKSDSGSYNLADFIFGLPSQAQLANYLVGSYRQRQYFLYVQDDYRVTSKLTLNLGLRWEFATPRWERDNVLSNFDPTTNTILTASNGGVYNRTLVNPDYRDWAPRLGLAYSFDQKTVFRSGYGISYVHLERLGSADELGINGPQVDIATLNQALVGGHVPAGFLTNYGGFPTGFASPASFNPVNANISYIPANTRWPYVQSWFASVQREFTKDTMVEIAYTGNHSLRLPILGDYNQALPNAPGGALGIQPRRPDQAFGAITYVDPAGFQNYNGLSVRFEHKTSHGLYFLNSFTWSKSLTDSEQALEYGSGYYAANVQNINDLANERGPSSLDATLINTTSFVYELPFGKGRRFGSSWNSVLDGILGGWEANTINTANSGTPLDVAYTPTATNDVTGRIPDYRGEAIMRPNVIPSASPITNDPINHYYGAYSFTVPSASAPFGNVGRNSFRGPDFWQWDLGVDKFFQIRENLRLQFRSEFFNVLNHTNFGIPDSNISDAAFGTIRSTFPARQIQFAVKVLF